MVNMKTLIALSSLVLLFTTGCSDDFATNMVDAQSGSKTRPFAVVCEPPEAAPGDTVRVTLHCYEPMAADFTPHWRLALDYDIDIYEGQQTEGAYVDLHDIAVISPPIIDEDGLARQSFTFTVPEEAILASSGLDEILDEPLPAELRAIIDPVSPEALTKAEIDAFLATADPADYSGELGDALLDLAELFACQVRLRATLNGVTDLDLTKNLTVRYAARWGSDNLNHNPELAWVALLAVHHEDLQESDDIGLYAVDTTYVYHQDPELMHAGPVLIDRSLTYFMEMGHEEESYLSPGGLPHTETHQYWWYFLKRDAGAGGHPILVDDEGEELNSALGDEIIRLDPPHDPELRNVSIIAVIRDERWEWELFNFTPGVDFLEIPIEFEHP
ncbi:MAG: hypothetical protein GY946_06550 [bacterium]|nr:hypothetical protein [bacterium]